MSALPARRQQALNRYVIVGGEAELLLLLHIFPEGVEELDGAFAVYAEAPPIGFDIVQTDGVGDDWPDRWREFHHGVRVGNFWVGPPWEAPEAFPGVRPGVGGFAGDASSPWEAPEAFPGVRPGVGGFAGDASSPWETIVIDPGRAFGTGAHPTTRLTLELLQTVAPGSLLGRVGSVEQASLLDIGCGSGVLSIGAAKLGFAPVTAVDVDDAAVEATLANAEANGVEVVSLRADALEDELPEADVVLANIQLELVERVVPRIRARTVITSGYLDRDRPALEGWQHVDRREADGWAADRFTLPA